MTRQVNYSLSAERHLRDLYDWIAAASTRDIAARFVASIMDRCDRLADFPMVGTARDDTDPASGPWATEGGQ